MNIRAQYICSLINDLYLLVLYLIKIMHESAKNITPNHYLLLIIPLSCVMDSSFISKFQHVKKALVRCDIICADNFW